jgi:hypothetical protein
MTTDIEELTQFMVNKNIIVINSYVEILKNFDNTNFGDFLSNIIRNNKLSGEDITDLCELLRISLMPLIHSHNELILCETSDTINI